MAVTKSFSSARFLRSASLVVGAALASAAVAQGGAAPQPAPNSAANLKLPENPQLFGTTMPSVVKARVLVNNEVITQTDVDQRLALIAISNGGEIPANEIDALRQQVLANLIDETLQIQAAKAEEIEISDADIDRTVQRVAGNVKQTPQEMADFLKARGSSIRSIRRQIMGETAWRRLQSKKIESGVNVGEEEVKSIIDKLNASKGSTEYRVGEIFLSSTTANEQTAQQNAARIFQALQQGGSFVGYARQYSEASTAAVGGDLGWVRPEQLPQELASAIVTMQPGQLTPPIKVPGGYSIIAVQDSRKILTPDPRDAVLSLKQVSISLPKGATRTQAEPILARFSTSVENIGGCGGAEKLASDFGGEVVSSDQVKMRDLPPALQQMMANMQVGQATRPFGSIEEGVRTLVLCGRDVSDPTAPTYEQVMNQVTEERVNMRARRYLRDLRRDAIIEFR
ncbi:peptidylprolyl isomerase [Sphingomonas jaspsi]|uniref:peptidylprolyl isomerase n=1 Tax=Sphingomonas jaspsi TaxID=392409 RepID=UPI001FDF86D5|nr:peptidylprolyl isomerase [Sphingomonas jaspsi]